VVTADVILTCYYSNAGFYTGRTPPSLRWAVGFLRSAYAYRTPKLSGPNARVVLFADAGTAATVARLVGQDAWGRDGSVLVLEAERGFGGDGATGWAQSSAFLSIVVVGNATHGDLLRETWSADIKNGANNFRFALFGDWVRRHRSAVGRTMMSDLTDVAFQANPFDACLPADITPAASAVSRVASGGCEDGAASPRVVFTMENSRKHFGNEKYNRRWATCFGDAAIANLTAKKVRISCAGVTFANRCGLEGYTAAQLRLIVQKDLVACAVDTIKAALDQATHNYLQAGHDGSVSLASRGFPDGGRLPFEVTRVWSEGGVDKAVAPEAGMGPTACTFHGNFGVPQFDKSGRIVDGRGRPFAVVHQYTSDRIPAYMAYVDKAYSLSDLPR
jgi:hypothetical protein